MLYHVRDIGLLAVDPRLDKAAVEKLSGGSDKRMTGEIFGIPRLLPDQHDAGRLRPFAEDGLCCFLVEMARGALSGRVAQPGDRRLGRDLDAGAGVFLTHGACPVRNSYKINTIWARPCLLLMEHGCSSDLWHGRVPNRYLSTEI